MKIYVFGTTGMLGNYILKLLNEYKKNVIQINRNTFNIDNLNYTNINNLFNELNISNNDIIINCIGIIPQSSTNKNITNIDYYKINSLFPSLLGVFCDKFKCRCIHITTDCVFSGKKGSYTEIDIHDEKSDYGVSKSLGELYDNITIIRTSIIGEEIKNKYSLLEWVKSNRNSQLNGYTNHYWNGITCLQLAKIINYMIDRNLFWKGVRHIFSPNIVSKYELCNYINEIYNLNIRINKYNTKDNIDKTLSTIYNENMLFNIPDIYKQIIEQKNYIDNLVKINIIQDVEDETLNNYFTSIMLSDKPLWISRIGGSDYEIFKLLTNIDLLNNNIINYMINKISIFNGFFVKNINDSLRILQLSKNIYFNSLKSSDICTVSTYNVIEKIITNKNIDDEFGNNCKFITNYSFIEAIQPFFKSFQIWGNNKKILIISPFSKTIEYQVHNDRINKLLKFKFPDCIFKTYTTPITYNVPNKNESNYFTKQTNNYNNWIELAQHMINEINLIDYDIAFISSGIYSMYIGEQIKKQGKKAIYIGGVLNVIFNIYGGRYDTSFFNNIKNKEYEIKVIDNFDDLFQQKQLNIKNEVLGAYF